MARAVELGLAAAGAGGVRARIGYVPERLALPASWTASAYVRSVARLKRHDSAQRELTEAELAPARARRARSYQVEMALPLVTLGDQLGECARGPRDAPPP